MATRLNKHYYYYSGEKSFVSLFYVFLNGSNLYEHCMLAVKTVRQTEIQYMHIIRRHSIHIYSYKNN